MTSTRLVVLGIAVAALVLALVLAAAGQTLGDLRRSRARRSRPAARGLVQRVTPPRTRLKPYSPEVLALVLVALAAGLWLSRLLG